MDLSEWVDRIDNGLRYMYGGLVAYCFVTLYNDFYGHPQAIQDAEKSTVVVAYQGVPFPIYQDRIVEICSPPPTSMEQCMRSCKNGMRSFEDSELETFTCMCK